MSLRAHGKYIQKAVKMYDRELFVSPDYKDTLCVWRKRFRYDKENFGEPLGEILYGRPDPELVFALTDTWTQRGNPIDWGPEVVCERLRKIDFWDNQKLFEEMDEANDRVDQRRKKHWRGQIEDFAKEWRRPFKKAFDWVNTSTLDKKLDPRRIQDGRRKQDERYC